MKRREFLRTLGMAGGAALVEGLWGEREAFCRARRPLRIVVVGAGLSGLCVAYELERRGHQVVILEAERDHLGGRVRTLRFDHGLYGEAGAMRIPQSHSLTRHYLREFGIPLRRFVEYNPEAYAVEHGRRRRNREVIHPDPRLAAQGAAAEPGSIWRERFDEVVGGMDQLPAAFVRRLHSLPRRGCEVMRLEQATSSAAVVYREHGRLHRLEGDIIVCTLPFPVLQRLEVHPPFSPEKQAVLRQMEYAAASKALVVARRRFWESEEGIFGGASYSDLPTEMTYYPSDNAKARRQSVSAGPGVLLASYTLGPYAEVLDHLPAARRTNLILHSLAQIHPQVRHPGLLGPLTYWSWANHPWSRGAFARPGQEELAHRAAQPEGRIHFAGEHTSLHPTWMQGALESALRVVRSLGR